MARAYSVAGLFLLLWMAPLQASESEFDAFVERMRSAAGVAFQFHQVQQIAMLSKQLESHGRIVVVPRRGILWQTNVPFPDQQLMSFDGRILLEGGAQAHSNPVLTRMLVALFQFDLDTLREYFSEVRREQPGKWTLDLAPTSRWLESELAMIQIAGGKVPQRVTIRYANGSTSHLRIEETVWLDKAGASEELAPWAAHFPAGH